MGLDWEKLKARVARAMFDLEGYTVPTRYTDEPNIPGQQDKWCWKEIGQAVADIGPIKMIPILEETFKDEPELRDKMRALVQSVFTPTSTPLTLSQIKARWKDLVGDDPRAKEDALASIERGLLMAVHMRDRRSRRIDIQ